MTIRRRVVGTILATVVAVLSAGCGLPVSNSPTRIDPSTVPYGLLDTNGSGAPAIDRGRAVPIYLVDGDHLVAVTRHVTGTNVPARALATLLLGPTALESEKGYRTAIPSQAGLVSLDLRGEIATVDLSSAFGALGGSEQVLAVAQIVYTLTASPRISAVEFAVGDNRVAVPNGHGALDMAPRTRADYRPQAPQRQSASSHT